MQMMSAVSAMQSAGHDKPHGTGSIVPALAQNARAGHPQFQNGNGKRGSPGHPPYYDENVGRFTGEDPIRFKGGPNFYEYAESNPVTLKDAYGLQAECTLVGQRQVTPWIPTATVSSQTPWVYKDFSEIDDKGIATVRCKWVNTVTKALWGSALFGLEYRCVLKLPCGLALEYNSYDFEWHTRSEGQRTDPDWTGTSYTTYPLDDGDLFYESLCKLRNPN